MKHNVRRFVCIYFQALIITFILISQYTKKGPPLNGKTSMRIKTTTNWHYQHYIMENISLALRLYSRTMIVLLMVNVSGKITCHLPVLQYQCPQDAYRTTAIYQELYEFHEDLCILCLNQKNCTLHTYRGTTTSSQQLT